MKKLIFFLFAIISLNAGAQNFTATVNQEQGYYIFTDCKPASDYQTIESFKAKSVNLDFVSNSATGLSYDELKADIFKQISKAKKKGKLTGTNAIIFYPDRQQADVIKIK